MTTARLILLAAAAAGLSACVTQRVQPQPSPAIVEMRARAAAERAHPPSVCTTVSLDPGTVLVAPFAYQGPELTETGQSRLEDAATWLTCHPGIYAVITGAADPTGTAEAQKQLAAQRVQAARAYLITHGVASGRLLTARPAGGVVLSISAEGRRW